MADRRPTTRLHAKGLASLLAVLAISITARPVQAAPKNPRSPTPAPTATPRPTLTPTLPPTPAPTPPPPPDGLAVAIESPLEGATLLWSTVDVSGTMSGDGPLGVVVNGVTALTGVDRDGRRVFFVDDLALPAGSTTISASALTIEGSTVEHAVDVTAGSAKLPVRLGAEPIAGTAPLDVQIEVEIDAGVPFQHPQVDLDGDGTADATYSSTTTAHRIFTEPGLHRVRLQSKSSGRPIVDEVAILVEAPSDLVASLQAQWEEFRAALRTRDLDRALLLTVSSSRDRSAALLGALVEQGLDPDAFFGEIHHVRSYAGMVEFQMLRPDASGQAISYPVYFSRDMDGIWRIKSF